jgi:hypothetical protein
MWISSKKTLKFPKLQLSSPNHPLCAAVAKYPEGYSISNGETKEAPEWITQDRLFELVTKEGSLTIREPAGAAELQWRIPESTKADPTFWQSRAKEFQDLQQKQDASMSSRNRMDGVVAYSASNLIDGSGSWELCCGRVAIEAAFEEIVARAARSLSPSDDVDGLSCWFHYTWLYLRTSKHKRTHTFLHDWACIVQPIEASAAHCSKLAQEMFEMQRNPSSAQSETARTDPQQSRSPEAQIITELAARRQQFLRPLLNTLTMTVNQWADNVEEVVHSTVFRYWNGETTPNIRTRAALAKPLGLKAEDLPK